MINGKLRETKLFTSFFDIKSTLCAYPYNGHTSTATRLSSWHNVYSVQFFALISVVWVIFLHEPPFVRYLGKTGKNHDFALTLRSILDMKEWQQDEMSYIFKISIKCSIRWHFKNFKNFISSIVKKFMKYSKIAFKIWQR